MPRSTAYRAVCVGNEALKHLFYGGVLVSVFSNTLNIRTRDDELVVITTKSMRSPIHINVKPATPFSLKAMTKAGFEGGKIRLENATVILDGYTSYRNNLIPPSERGLKAFRGLARRFSTLLALTDTQALERGPVGERIMEFSYSLLEGRFRPDLILGLGPGFTPSGDDVLSGYLACRNHLASAGLLAPRKVSPKGRTAWVSGKLIEYYQSLKVDSTLEEGLNAISMGRPDMLVEAVLKLAPRGHTSGPDMAFGMLLALYETIGELDAFLVGFK